MDEILIIPILLCLIGMFWGLVKEEEEYEEYEEIVKEDNKDKINFLGIGGARCASTWLLYCLREHPDLQVPLAKLQYFIKQPNGKSKYDREGIEGYYKKFGKIKENKKVGELTTAYLYDKKTCELIKEHFPKAKIIVSIREPTSRYISHYNWIKNYEFKGYAMKSNNQDLNVVKYSLYYDNLKRWLDNFEVKIILFDDIEKNPEKVIKEVYEFLGVDSNFIPSIVTKKINAQGKVKSKFMFFIQITLSKTELFFRKLKLMINILRKLKVNNLFWKIFYSNIIEVKAEPIEITDNLKELFLGDIEKTEILINQDLSKWKEEIKNA